MIDRSKPIDFTVPGDWWKEPGLFQTRDGRKVRIYAVDGGGDHPVHGSYWNDNEAHWSPETWTKDGMVSEEGESRRDLVYAPRAKDSKP